MTATSFRHTSEVEFNSIVDSIDRRRYKVIKRLEGSCFKWYYMPIQRRGLYRSAIRDSDKVLFAQFADSVYSIGAVPE